MLLQSPQAMTPRIDLSELKSQLGKRLGPERTRRYFSYLHRLLSLKLSKADFNKLCFLTLGRENLPLHNLLIQSVIKNALLAKSPPSLGNPLQRTLKSTKSPVLTNGDILAPCPDKRCLGTQSSKLGLCEGAFVSSQENVDFGYLYLKKPQEGKDGVRAEQSVKRRRVNRNGIKEVVVTQDEEFMEQESKINVTQRPLQAPLGIPYCPAIGGSKKLSTPAGSASICSFTNFWGIRELCHTEGLWKRMEVMVEAHGLEGVTLDCANLLNNGLDAYLKLLIKSSLELAKARMGHETSMHSVEKQLHDGKLVNGISLGNVDHVHCSGGPLHLQEGPCYLLSLLDVAIAMKLNAWQFGEVAPVLLEKICYHSFEE